jgi:hypothetical protein
LFPSTRKIRCRVWWGSRRSASSNAAPIIEGMSSVIEAGGYVESLGAAVTITWPRLAGGDYCDN